MVLNDITSMKKVGSMSSNNPVSGNVGSELVFENDKIRVWNFELAVGEETVVHKHEYPYMWYAITATTLQTLDEDGNDVGTLDVPEGSIYVLKLEDEKLEITSEIGRGASVPATHSAKNVSTIPYREILVEWKS